METIGKAEAYARGVARLYQTSPALIADGYKKLYPDLFRSGDIAGAVSAAIDFDAASRTWLFGRDVYLHALLAGVDAESGGQANLGLFPRFREEYARLEEVEPYSAREREVVGALVLDDVEDFIVGSDCVGGDVFVELVYLWLEDDVPVLLAA